MVEIKLVSFTIFIIRLSFYQNEFGTYRYVIFSDQSHCKQESNGCGGKITN